MTGVVGRARILVVTSDPLSRSLVQVALEDEPHLEVVGACDGSAALRVAAAGQPEVIVLWLRPPEEATGLARALARQVPGATIVDLGRGRQPARPGTPGAVASWHGASAGDLGDVHALRRAVAAAAAGPRQPDPATGGPLGALRPRQRQIVALVARGLSNEAIARRLDLAPKTVDNQLSQIYEALGLDRASGGVHPRVATALFALRDPAGPVRVADAGPAGPPPPYPWAAALGRRLRRLYQEATEGALVATDASAVTIIRVDRRGGRAVGMAFAAGPPDVAARGRAELARTVPAYRPDHFTLPLGLNPDCRAAFMEPRVALGPFGRIAAGQRHPEALEIFLDVFGLRQTLHVPLVVTGQVVGAMDFCFRAAPTAGQVATAMALARQPQAFLETAWVPARR